jgi:aminopeptidase-like protein
VTSGNDMFKLAEKLWPIGRSLSGEGVRQTLDIIQEQLPQLKVGQYSSGDSYSDWTIPKEWNVKEAYIIDPTGQRICDYSVNNLHLVGYSVPVDKDFTLEDLEPHLFSLPDQPTAIPYVTSYYQENWGFCITQEERSRLTKGIYRVVIDTTLKLGELNYGELNIEGVSKREILFSTYICHPSMANNELSGPVLATELAKFISTFKPYYSYKFLFIPETIGSIAYISKNLESLKRQILAGYVLTCVGDERIFSYLPSRHGSTIADREAIKVLNESGIKFKMYSWRDRGSDERQYCAPGVDLPVCSVMRSKYGEYPEYHTSLDDLGSVVTAKGLQGSFDFYKSLIINFEKQRFPKIKTLGEPQLGKRNLYPNTSIKGVYANTRAMMDTISFFDGTNSISDVAKKVDMADEYVENLCTMLEREGLVDL